MDKINIQQETEQIVDRFAKVSVSLDKKEVSDRLELLINTYKVQANEAIKSVIGFFRVQHNIKFEDMKSQSTASVVNIRDIAVEDSRWLSLKAKVVQLWEPSATVIHQTGLIGDETGTIKFTIFTKGAEKHINVVEGQCYEFNNLVTGVWNGQVSVKVNTNSIITPIQEDISVSKQKTSLDGVIVAILPGSGIIKRCPKCHRYILKGSCGEHGRIEGTYDLRIKAVLAQIGKTEPIDLILNKTATENVTGIDLTRAIEMATDALDADVVSDTFKNMLLGRYYSINGTLIKNNTMLVDTMTPLCPEPIRTQELLTLAIGGGK